MKRSLFNKLNTSLLIVLVLFLILDISSFVGVVIKYNRDYPTTTVFEKVSAKLMKPTIWDLLTHVIYISLSFLSIYFVYRKNARGYVAVIFSTGHWYSSFPVIPLVVIAWVMTIILTLKYPKRTNI